MYFTTISNGSELVIFPQLRATNLSFLLLSQVVLPEAMKHLQNSKSTLNETFYIHFLILTAIEQSECLNMKILFHNFRL